MRLQKLATNPWKLWTLPDLSGVVSLLHSQCPHYLCSLFLIDSLLSAILCVSKFFSNSCLDYLDIWRHIQGLVSGDSPPPSFPPSFLFHWTLCEQANDCGSNWGTLARVTLWCVPKAPLPTVPQYLTPKQVRALLSSFPSFSLKLRTRPVKIVRAQVRHLKSYFSHLLFEDSHDGIGQSWLTASTAVAPRLSCLSTWQIGYLSTCPTKTTSVQHQVYIGSSKTQPTPLAAPFPAGLQGRFLSLSSLLLFLFLPWSGLIYRSLGIAPESSQREPSMFQGVVWSWVTHLVLGISFSVPSCPSCWEHFRVVCILACICVGVCAQLCPALYSSMDSAIPGSSVHGIFQARILEWVAISYSRVSSLPRDWTWVSCIGRQILYQLCHLGGPDVPKHMVCAILCHKLTSHLSLFDAIVGMVGYLCY